jgi:peptidoglycan hydrolase-like protein with peptidoglycan-binding domain
MANAAGEDRSNFQEVGPWTNDAFGIVKATEGITFQDGTFAENWANLKGKPRGAYHFFHPAVDAVSQARYFVAFVRQHGLTAQDMLAADVELTLGSGAAEVLADSSISVPRMHVEPQAVTVAGPQCQHSSLPTPVYGATQWCVKCNQYCGGVSTESREPVACTGCLAARAGFVSSFSLGAVVLEFLDEVVALTGIKPELLLTYTTRAIGETLGEAVAAKSALWTAQWDVPAPSGLGPWKDWAFWQFRSGGGQGGGDSDVFNGDEAQLKEYVGEPVPPPPPPAPGIPAWQTAILDRLPELREGASDSGGHVEWVHQLQLLIDITGAASVTADGDFGLATLGAVKATQASRHIAEDGVAGPETWQVLIASEPGFVLAERVGPGANDSGAKVFWVHRIQAYCNTHAIPTAIDGVYGAGTENAVKAVQRAYSEPETGVVDPVTWSLLIAHARP